MSKEENILKFNHFRSLCLANAEAALHSAKQLRIHHANHIVYHLIVLSLEEIGKIFVGYNELLRETKWDEDKPNFGFDDHMRKLFWAIWGPSIGKEIITKEQWNENQKMATALHQKRLDTLYTAMDDTVPGSEKITDEAVAALYSFAEARLNLSKIEGEVEVNATPDPNNLWFNDQLNNPERRKFIFGAESQQKLLSFENTKLWIQWLREYYEKEEGFLLSLAEKEIRRQQESNTEKIIPKWKMKIKVNTPSHSIRSNVLDTHNTTSENLKLFKGGDNHTLLIEFTFGNDVTAGPLWHYGWLISKFYVGSLNIATNGFFYWNTPKDTEKYYESLHDIESDQQLKVTVQSGLHLNWEQRKMTIREQDLNLTDMLFHYFIQLHDPTLMGAANLYFTALALMAKSDIHSRFEALIFGDFFQSFKIAVTYSLGLKQDADFISIAFQQLSKTRITQSEFERVLNIGIALVEQSAVNPKQISLADVILMKQYCGFYFMTLAARKFHGDDSLLLIME